MAKKPQLHQSQIRRLGLCGEQFRRIHRCGDRRPPGAAAYIGSANDRAHKFDLQHKIDEGTLESLGTTSDVVRETINSLFEEGVHLVKGEKEKVVRGDAIDKAVRMNKVRHEELAPVIRPVAVGTKWVAELEGYPYDLAGEFDVEDEVIPIRDLKASGKYPAASLADDSVQLDMYALYKHFCGGEALPMKVALDVVTDVLNKTGPKTTAKILVSERTEGHVQSMLARVERIMECLEKDVFIPADPGDWICGPKWCGFFTDCPYAKGRVQVGYGG